tara:strand:+ start:429 stop:545 length:117 start_codon:yes stop_codon:yes gene_type:complete
MTSYYLDEIFNTWESANEWLKNNIGNTCTHYIEEVIKK